MLLPVSQNVMGLMMRTIGVSGGYHDDDDDDVHDAAVVDIIHISDIITISNTNLSKPLEYQVHFRQ